MLPNLCYELSVVRNMRIYTERMLILCLVLIVCCFTPNRKNMLIKKESMNKMNSNVSIIYNSPEVEHFAMKMITTKTKKILLYDKIWLNVKYDQGMSMFYNCRYSNCFLSGNTRLYKWEEWDAVLWDNVFSNHKFKPHKRYPATRYVIMSRETPAKWGQLKKWPVTFNWTMTYRTDSDIPFRFGYVYKLKNQQPFILPKNKTRLAAWMCSNPNSASGREQLRKELEKYMSIDIYGKTGNLTCGPLCRAYKGSKCDSDCRDMIGNKYKFYFAFENSLCKDSFTEKLYTMLQRPIIPVIWSGANYTLLAPPNSVINAFDFDTAKDLVDYLNYLDKNETAYFEYFKWKTSYRVIAGSDTVSLSFCFLCASLHQDPTSQWYENLHDWWSKDQCTNPNTDRIRKFLNITEAVHLPYK